jgi:hypothetical protein
LDWKQIDGKVGYVINTPDGQVDRLLSHLIKHRRELIDNILSQKDEKKKKKKRRWNEVRRNG